MTEEKLARQGETSPDSGTISLRVKLNNTPAQAALYANHAVVNVGPTEIVLTFAQALLPPFLEASELASVLGQPPEVMGRVVAQIVMPHAKFGELVDSLTAMVESLRQQGIFPKPADGT